MKIFKRVLVNAVASSVMVLGFFQMTAFAEEPVETATTFNIRYDLAGGNAVNDEFPGSYSTNEELVFSPVAEKTGYAFNGWIAGQESEPQMQISIPKGTTGDLFFEASYEVKEYTVNFDANGGSGTMESQTIRFYDMAKLQKNAFTAPEGKAFAGWSRSATGTPNYVDEQPVRNIVSPVSGDTEITLYAVWFDVTTPKCIYESNNYELGTPITVAQEYEDGCFSIAFELEACEFVEWQDQSGSSVGTDVIFSPSEPGTYTAVFQQLPLPYTTEYYKENADGTYTLDRTTNPETLYGETPVYGGNMPEKAEDDEYTYTFAGWMPEVVPATEDSVYTATYDKVKKQGNPMPTPKDTGESDSPKSYQKGVNTGDNDYSPYVSSLFAAFVVMAFAIVLALCKNKR